jgi:hypothetical protein
MAAVTGSTGNASGAVVLMDSAKEAKINELLRKSIDESNHWWPDF